MSDAEQKRIFSKNLISLLNKHGKSQKEVAEAISVSPQTFNTWCQGIALPRMGKIQKLADYFMIDKTALIDENETGKIKAKNPSDTMEQLKKEFNLDDFSYNLVYQYLKLDTNQRQIVRNLFYNIVKSEHTNEYLFSDIPKTPEELEKEFPPIKENSKETG